MTPANVHPALHAALQTDGASRHKVFALQAQTAADVTDLQRHTVDKSQPGKALKLQEQQLGTGFKNCSLQKHNLTDAHLDKHL